MSVTPYSGLPDKAFWRTSIAGRHISEVANLVRSLPDLRDAKIATAGSCFAQHIGKALRTRGLQYLDYEPAPEFLSAQDADRFGYGVYSCRYGNLYTVRQLWQLFQEVFGTRKPAIPVWENNGRYFDALRPGIEKEGFASADEVLALRASHLRQVKRLFEDLDVFVFTFGLTEAWTAVEDGTTYPVAPGVIAGKYDPEKFRLDNFRYPAIMSDMTAFIHALREINPKAKFILTVSPVSLAATATDEHVLVANTYSKSTLRAVAGDLAAENEGVFYFPSFEIIATHPSRGMHGA